MKRKLLLFLVSGFLVVVLKMLCDTWSLVAEYHCLQWCVWACMQHVCVHACMILETSVNIRSQTFWRVWKPVKFDYHAVLLCYKGTVGDFDGFQFQSLSCHGNLMSGVCVCLRVCMCLYVCDWEREIKSWLVLWAWLWRLRFPSTCSYSGGNPGLEFGDIMVIHCLTGWLPEAIPLQWVLFLVCLFVCFIA